jgi:alpha-1,6-mannosyltransferase
MWIVASAYWLARRKTGLASIAFVLAVATKLLPIVLLPLYWRRVRLRDAAAGATLLTLLCLGYTRHGTLPLGAVPSVVEHVRFNGPVFRFVAGLGTPRVAALVAVGLGLIVAAWARWRLDANNPAAWVWPMGIALAAAPVIYPWYLLYLTPFLFTLAVLPITVWTITIIPTYTVWQLVAHGGRWTVPPALLRWEYGIPIGVGMFLAWRMRAWRSARPAELSQASENPVAPAIR